jgi:hypothetical protein
MSNFEETQSVSIQLGDIFEIVAPTEPEIHQKIFLVNYIGSNKIKTIYVDNETKEFILRIDDDGTLADKAIVGLNLISRDDNIGYAKQNLLLPNTWIDIHFSGDLPTIMTGLITNLEEDMIEIKTYPDNEVIYIDFGYKGLPEDIPINKINIREAPDDLKPKTLIEETKSESEIQEGTPREFEDEYIESVSGLEEEQTVPVSVVKKQIKELLLDADQIELGADLGEIVQLVEVPEGEQRYGIDKQTNDLLDEMLSTIPNAQRTGSVLTNIHRMIERFKQLRVEFSKFDKYGNADMPDIQGANYKPLVNSLSNINKKLYWLLPVCTNRKKVYDIGLESGAVTGNENREDINQLKEIYPDIISLQNDGEILNENQIIKYYTSNNIPNGEDKYSYLIKNLSDIHTPYEEPKYQEFNLATKTVNDNIDAIVDNLGELESSIIKNDGVVRRKFIIQTYNLGLSKLETFINPAKKVFLKKITLTTNDKFTVNSYISLPEPVFNYSHINLPGTNILDKSNLNIVPLIYSRILNKKTNVNSHIVENFENDLPYNEETYLNNVKQYILSENINDADKYEKYLNAIIPKTRILFDLVKKNIKGRMSLYSILKYLEPFLIYHKDLSFKQYETINAFIDEKIKEFKANYVKQYTEFKKAYANVKPHVNYSVLLDNATNNIRNFYDSERDDNISDIELINKMNSFDNGKLFSLYLAKINAELMVPESVNEFIENKAQYNQSIQSADAQNACRTEVISKKYLNKANLENDNNKTIYFDKNYDPTYYDILNEYKREFSRMERDEFIQFLSSKLMEINGFSSVSANREAIAMIDGKRAVLDGEYAILQIDTADTSSYKNRIQTSFYKRINNKWEIDETIDDGNLLAESNKLFCNLSESCYSIKNKCNDNKLAEKQLKKTNVDQIFNEFKDKLNYDASELNKKIDDLFNYYISCSDILYTIKEEQRLKYSEQQQSLGEYIETTDIKHSPYNKLRDLILGQNDFVKKQKNIIKFIDKFTRKAIEYDDEDIYWDYCIETNVKLIPTFLRELAREFILNGDYLGKLDKICAERGTISDDGNVWVDKHSGYFIKRIDFDNEEGYDESGFKITTRQLLDRDIEQIAIKNDETKHGDKNYISTEAQQIFKIVEAMASQMSINISEDQIDFIITNALYTIERTSFSKEKYEASLNAALAKGKKNLPTFEEATDSNILYTTLAYFLIGVITSIPSIKTRKTFPTCIKSFTGYPLTGVEDKSGLTYIACVAKKIASKSIRPWNVITRVKEDAIISKIEQIIEKHLTVRQEINDKLQEKRLYLEKGVVEEIPDDINIAKWNTFLPPLRELVIKSPTPVSTEFYKTFKDNIRRGNVKQYEQINVLKSKVINFSLAIQKIIQNVVEKEKPILKTASFEPFLENTCCNKDELSTHDYFVKRDRNIVGYNDVVKELSNIIYDVKRMGEAPFIIDPRDTKLKIPSIDASISTENIYLAFITYCKFNNKLPISETLKSICLEKPDNFNVDDNLKEKINFLKNNGKNYSIQNLEQLMDIINHKNIINLELTDNMISFTQVLRNLTEYKKDMGQTNQFDKLLFEMIDTFDIALKEDTKEMRNMKNYLAKQNLAMKTDIINFIKTNTRLKKNEIEDVNSMINEIMTFHETDNNLMSKEDATTYKSVEFIKNTLRNIIDVYPNIIINNVDYSSIEIPKHWNLSQRHNGDIKNFVEKYYSNNFNKFYEDKEIQLMLSKIKQISNEYYTMALNTPFLSPIMREGNVIYSIFERRMAEYLFTYYIFNVFKKYISLSNDKELLIKEIPKAKEYENTINVSAFEEFQNGELNEVEIVEGNKKELAEKIASVLVSFIKMIRENKQIINYDYNKIMDSTMRVKENEKDLITDYLAKMSKDEREVENMKKQNKLGRWNVGLQKGLTQYVKETYDQEREQMEKNLLIDIQLGKNKDITEMNKDIFALDYEERMRADEEADKEAYDMRRLRDDDDYPDEDEYDDVENQWDDENY